MRDIQPGDHVWYELRQEWDRSLSSRTIVDMRAIVERVTENRITIRPYVGYGRNRQFCRARAVAPWKVRLY